MLKSESASLPAGQTVSQCQDQHLKLIFENSCLLGPKSWQKLNRFVFLSGSLDENVLLHVGAAGHRTHLCLDTNSFRREEISDQGLDCR